MQHPLCDERDMYQRHFMDVFGGVSNVHVSSHCSDDAKKLKRRPKCKTRNKHIDKSSMQMCDDFCHKAALFGLPNSAVVVPSRNDECPASTDIAHLELVSTEYTKVTDISVQRTESLLLFEVLCSSLQSSENVTAHHAAALSRWLSHRQVLRSADSSLVQILMASKRPLVSFVCCRLLKRLCMMSFLCPPTVAVSDVISYVLFLQKEMVKFLESGQFSMNLINVICLLECIAVICRNCNLVDYCSKVHFSNSQFCTDLCSSELRWAVLSVVSLANVVSAKVKLTSVASRRAVDADRNMRSVTELVERVPQIAGTVLCTSVQCELAQVQKVFRLLNEYWHTMDVCQRCLIVESVLVPKLRMELCVMILARHCNVLLQERVAASLSLDDIVVIFDENTIVSAITQQVWVENGVSVVSYCQEICLILCNAVCSYILYRKGD